MSPEVVGALAGALLGIVNLVVLWSVAARMEKESPPERAKVARIIRGVALIDIFLFATVGYYVGPMTIG
jgi:hypothetical protein